MEFVYVDVFRISDVRFCVLDTWNDCCLQHKVLVHLCHDTEFCLKLLSGLKQLMLANLLIFFPTTSVICSSSFELLMYRLQLYIGFQNIFMIVVILKEDMYEPGAHWYSVLHCLQSSQVALFVVSLSALLLSQLFKM